jgi:hypothetical protein
LFGHCQGQLPVIRVRAVGANWNHHDDDVSLTRSLSHGPEPGRNGEKPACHRLGIVPGRRLASHGHKSLRTRLRPLPGYPMIRVIMIPGRPFISNEHASGFLSSHGCIVFSNEDSFAHSICKKDLASRRQSMMALGKTRIIWNPPSQAIMIHLVHVGTYRYVLTCTDLYDDIVCTGTYYLRHVA